MSDNGRIFPVVVTPTKGVDPRVALSTSIVAAPQVYAVLVGSGMSTAAGIPTGWQVVQDLIRRIAVADGVLEDELGEYPETWWVNQGYPEPSYDTLLQMLAPTDLARRAILRKYFDPSSVSGKSIEPTSAHDALAYLCETGYVRLILTTNFDSLIERALGRRGIYPQVISNSESVKAMIPLEHAPTTVIKLHGDYNSSGLLNTPEELSEYSCELKHLVSQIFDSFGLLVIGWSSEYDIALKQILINTVSRRYPIYWCAFNGNLTDSAKQIITQRQAAVIETSGADDVLPDLVQRIDRLEQVAKSRNQPRGLRYCRYSPDLHSTPSGWDVLPLLQCRTAGEIELNEVDIGIIRTEHRKVILSTLTKSNINARLKDLGQRSPKSSQPDVPLDRNQVIILSTSLGNWEPTPGGIQSTDEASYRTGSNGQLGVSALATIRFPFNIPNPNSAVFALDIGISLASELSLVEIACLLIDGLILVTNSLPIAISDILGPNSEVSRCEFHILASSMDGTGSKRDNNLDKRLDLTTLGVPSRELSSSLGYAASLTEPLVKRTAIKLVCDAVEYLALAHGFLDPEQGMSQLRKSVNKTFQFLDSPDS